MKYNVSYVHIFLLASAMSFPHAAYGQALTYGANPHTSDEEVGVLESVAGGGVNTVGNESSSSINLSNVESGEAIEIEESVTAGGDYSRMRSAAAYSTSLVKQRANSYFSSPAAVFESAVAMTGGVIHQGLAAAEEASRDEAMGALAQEQAYILSLQGRHDASQRLEMYRNCKQRILQKSETLIDPNNHSAGKKTVSIFQAIKHCTGGYNEAVAEVPAGAIGNLENADESTRVNPNDQSNLPDPISVQKLIRQGQPLGMVNDERAKCSDPTTPLNENLPISNIECFQRTLWDYAYHDVKPENVAGYNPKKWMWSDEKELYFGNVLYTEYLASQTTSEADSPSTKETNKIITRAKKIEAPKRWVNFWGRNGEQLTPTYIPVGYQTGHWTPLSGAELIRATMFQDIYGGLYALSYKMCEHANAEIKLLKRSQYNALSRRCEFWEAPLDAQWEVGSGPVPGLGIQAFGCNLTQPQGPTTLHQRRVFPVIAGADYEYLWPSRVQLLTSWNGVPTQFANNHLVNWQPRRYYENWENVSELPTMKTLLGHLELSPLESMMIRDILLLEIPKETTGTNIGDYKCGEMLKGVSLGQIMEFSELIYIDPITDATWASLYPGATGPNQLITYNYRKPKSASWPLKSEVVVSPPGLNPPVIKEVSARMELFYLYANRLAQLRAITTVEKELAALGNRSDTFPDKLQHAAKLISDQLPSGAGLITEKAIIREALVTVKSQLRELHEELKSAARFTDKAGKRSHVASGAASKP